MEGSVAGTASVRKVPRLPASLFLLLALAASPACGPEERPPGSGAEAPPAGAATPAAGPEEPDSAALLAAASDVLDFLEGGGGFDDLRLADSVTLLVAPEGGGARRTVARQDLRDPALWTAPDPRGRPIAFRPPPSATERTLRVGRHLRCGEGPLADAAPELAGSPHVGVMLRPPGPATSCLQAWSLTLVFAPGTAGPVLTAAVYDQWEW